MTENSFVERSLLLCWILLCQVLLLAVPSSPTIVWELLLLNAAWVSSCVAWDWVRLLAGLLDTCSLSWNKHWLKEGEGCSPPPPITPLSYLCFVKQFSKNISLVIQSLPHLRNLPFIQGHQRCPMITTSWKKENSWKAILCVCFTLSPLALALLCFASYCSCFLPAQHILLCVCSFLFLCCLKDTVRQSICSGVTCLGRKEIIAGFD